MKENIDISVIVPMCNSSLYLRETLNSIVSQENCKWECIVVDDGSDDDSIDIASEYVKEYSNFRLVQREPDKPKGGNSCRNIGLDCSKSDYVMFVDADDSIGKDCLVNRLNYIKNETQVDMWIFPTAFVNNEKEITGRFFPGNMVREELICRLVEHKIPWQTMSVVWKKVFLNGIGGWNEDYERLQDVELNIRALLNNPKMKHVNHEVDSYYRFAPMTLSKRYAARSAFCKLIRDYFIKLTEDKTIAEAIRTTISDAFQRQIGNLFLVYLNDDKNIDLKWSRLYLSTLEKVGICDDDLNSVKKILANFNNPR